MLLGPHSWFLGAPTDLQLRPDTKQSLSPCPLSLSRQYQKAAVAFVPTAGKAHGAAVPREEAKQWELQPFDNVTVPVKTSGHNSTHGGCAVGLDKLVSNEKS